MDKLRNFIFAFLCLTTILVINAFGSPPAETRSAAPPVNDAFISATVTNNEAIGAAPGSNVDATKEPGEPFHAGNSGGKSVWYRWTAPGTFGVTFSTQNSTTDFNTLLAVYVGGSVNTLAVVAANNNYGLSVKSSLTFAAVQGVTYYIAIDGQNSGSGPESGSFSLSWNVNRSVARGVDFDGGDPIDDITIFRPSNGLWVTRMSDGEYPVFTQWGSNGDIPVAADYDGDGKTDYAVFRPSNGNWYILGSFSGSSLVFHWGSAGDVPVMGDYNGDGHADFGVFRPSNGNWYVASSRLPFATILTTHWGVPNDKPVQADYDADGRTDIAVFRPSNGTWYILPSASNNSSLAIRWGTSGDVPVPGDYGNKFDGKSDVAVFRPSNGTWYALSSFDNSMIAAQWGVAEDIPQPMSGIVGPGSRVSTDFAVFRPSTGTWYLLDSITQETKVVNWGLPGDLPSTSAYTVQLSNVARTPDVPADPE